MEDEENMTLQERKSVLNPIARVLLAGVYDEASPLSKLLGIPHVLQTIWRMVIRYWKSLIQRGTPQTKRFFLMVHNYNVSKEEPLRFPKPSNININMMPFVMEKEFDKCFLPENLREYWEEFVLHGVLLYSEDTAKKEFGKICYLSIQESWVEAGTSQRRPGLHTENTGPRLPPGLELECSSPSNEEASENAESKVATKGGGSSENYRGFHHWGFSMGTLDGGIYLASSVGDSCQAWDCQVNPGDDGGEIIGHLGDIEHLREFLPDSNKRMREDTLYWITDRTPHESLPLARKTHRQWFRLVTSQVSLWFEDHSTKNPLGIVPDPDITTIVKGSKFEQNS